MTQGSQVRIEVHGGPGDEGLAERVFACFTACNGLTMEGIADLPKRLRILDAIQQKGYDYEAAREYVENCDFLEDSDEDAV